MEHESLVRLYQELDRRFDKAELRRLCFDLGVEYDNLPAEGLGKIHKAMELVRYLDRREGIDGLLTLCERERPSTNWKQLVHPQSATTAPIPFIPVRFFFLGCSFCSDETRRLLLRQNRIQSLFLFGEAKFIQPAEHAQAEQTISAFESQLTPHSTQSDIYDELLRFAECYQGVMEGYGRHDNQTEANPINLAITEMPVPANYYTWNTRDRRGIVIGINSLRTIFESDPQKVNKLILRVAQRMLIYALHARGLKAHKDTRGCLFDYTEYLPDISLSIEETYFCAHCKNLLIQDKGQAMFENLNAWITDA
jgi:hypothetical protein